MLTWFLWKLVLKVYNLFGMTCLHCHCNLAIIRIKALSQYHMVCFCNFSFSGTPLQVKSLHFAENVLYGGFVEKAFDLLTLVSGDGQTSGS